MKIKDIILEASSPAQQAAIAINMKKRGKKPKHVDELKTNTLKSYVGKRLARNPNVLTANPAGKTKKQRAGIDLAMDKILPGSAIRKPKIPSTENVEIIPEADATDTVSMDIPLLLRMMEYAREDAKTDEDLHDVAEKMIELSKHHDYLCMENYDEIVGSAAHDDMNEAVDNEYVIVDGKKVGAVWQDADGSWQSESAVTGMSWEGDDREDMVNHLIQIYNQAKREPSRSRRKEYMDNIASYNSETSMNEAKISEMATLLEALALRQVMISEGQLDEAGIWNNIKSAVGKGIGGVKSANDAINRLGQLAQNTTPVQNFDSRVETILQNIANKNPKTAEIARRYGEWAKKHPVKQGLIIGMLTAVASLAGGPAGGAAAAYVLRAGNELLKGEKASTAIGKGLKTAAIGGLAGMGLQQIANVMGHVPTHWSEIPGYKEIGSWQVQGDNGINFDVKLPAEQYPKVKKIWDMAQDAYAQGNAEKGNELSSYLTKYFNSPEYTNMLRDIKVKNIDLYQQAVAGAQRVQGIMSGIIAAAQGAVAGGGSARKTESVNENCPHCGGLMYEASLMNEKKDACYYKVKSRYKVWPSAYASGALVKCRKKGAKNWGKSK